MKISIGVEEFGKIKKAEIEMGRLILFVGENNSGKTFMMQLLYGVMSVIVKNSELSMKIVDKKDNDFVIDLEALIEWKNNINAYLEREKEQIVKDIFYREIPIGKIYVDIKDVDYTYLVDVKKSKLFHETQEDKFDIISLENEKEYYQEVEILLRRKEENTDEIVTVRKARLGGKIEQKLIDRYIVGFVIGDLLSVDHRLAGHRGDGLFLPASRTGMQLLYKYFFAEKDNKLYTLENDIQTQSAKNQLGLSAPIYDFLQFLLRFTPDSIISKKNQKLLDFIEENLIDGTLKLSNEESYYIPKNSDQMIPLYLSSSLINELAPIVKMLSNIYPYENLYYDEIETCLHPLKQKAMARLMIRMVNSGRRLVISTHSDSMAINLNNLLTLALGDWNEAHKQKKMHELGLEDDDILKTRDVHVYQFVNADDGTSSATELDFRTANNLGYNFELFNENLQKLSDDTIKIME